MKPFAQELTKSRRLGILLSVFVLLWQLVNLGLGRFFHEFLVADVVASLVLIRGASIEDDRTAARWMFGGFAAFGGIFLAATTGKLVVGGAHPGTFAALVGLAVSIVGAAGAGSVSD